MILVGTFSFIYHASQTRFGYTLDHAGISLAAVYWPIYEVYNLFEEDIGDVLAAHPLIALGTGMFEDFADVLSGVVATGSFVTVNLFMLFGGSGINNTEFMGALLLFTELLEDWQQHHE